MFWLSLAKDIGDIEHVYCLHDTFFRLTAATTSSFPPACAYLIFLLD